jgi:glycosyltransferase involved in cell wall biosynthesis
MKGVVVASPGIHTSYELAYALNQASMLARYITHLYYDPDSIWCRGLRILSSAVMRDGGRRLINRHREGLPPERVTTRPLAELICVSSTHLKWFRHRHSAVVEWRNSRFDHYVSGLAAKLQPEAVVCYDSCALRTFEAAKRIGARRILDQVVGHVRSGVKILREERELAPSFADGENIDLPERVIERCEQEALTADLVLAASEYVKTTLTANGVAEARIKVVPYGVDIERFAPRPLQERRGQPLHILFVGQIGLRKGVRYLLEALRQLGRCGAELTLVGGIAGGGRGLTAYRDHFKYVAHVPHGEMPRLYQQADVLVFPSLHEGSAFTTYEALACGLPVITTPNSGSVVRDGIDGFVVPIRDVETLKEKILLLIQNRELREEMSINARMRAEQFTWTAYRRRIAAIFNRDLRSGSVERWAMA